MKSLFLSLVLVVTNSMADGYAGKKFLCQLSKCNTPIHIIEHLSISVIADLLLIEQDRDGRRRLHAFNHLQRDSS